MDVYGARPRRLARTMASTALSLTVLALAAGCTSGAARPATATAPSTGPAVASASDDTAGGRTHSGQILVLGDSLAIGADDNGLSKLLKADGWEPQIVADKGRSVRGGILAATQEVPQVPPLTIVELGTNPSPTVATFAEEVDALVDLLHSRGATRIVWLTPVHHDDDRYDDKVNILNAKARADSSVVVADWRRVAWAHKAWFRGDGLHYTDVGFAALAKFIAATADINDPA
ncbi:MAG: hypothetical protein ACR2LQ_09195 [Acidimicrobiales bacterium]